MLQFVLGRAGSGKTEYMRRMLAERSLAGQTGLIMLVPEQYSFETEKAMMKLCGPVRANEIQVYSFTRLAETVFRKEGGAAGRRLSDGGRRILMSSAITACEDQLDVYQNAAQNGRITDVMLTALNEMKMCGILPEQLLDAAEKLEGRGLGKKLSELSLLYGTFEALVAASYLDSRDDLTRLAEHLQTSAFFEGCTVAVDSFEGFTAQEMAVLTQVMRRAESVTVSLCTDGMDRDGTGLFALVDRTRRRLSRAAEENGIKIAAPLWLTGSPRFENESLKLLESQLFCAEEEIVSQDHTGVELFEARDVFEESEFVAASIRRLVTQQGYRYRDFSIICRDPQRYYGSLDVALKKRDIPCFVSQPSKVDAEPVTRFILGAFEAVQSGFSTGDLLEMLKTGVSGFTPEEISDLENYAFLWKMKGSAWKEEFLRHPRGFGQEFTKEDQDELCRLNGLRARLMLPLQQFMAATSDATGEEISEAVYRLLSDYGMEENLPAYCRQLEEAGETSLAAKQLRVWDLLMELLDQMHSILGNRKTSRERYYKLLKEVVGAEDVSEIPQTLDEVIFGTAEQVRQSAPKVAFLIGAVQGEFPLSPKSSGVFSDAERRELIAMELPLGDPLEQKAMEERYLAYSVACAASRQLFVSWPRSAEGEEKEASELVSAVRAVFPTLEPLHDLPREFFADSKEAAFSRMAACFKENTGEAAAYRLLFQDDPIWEGRLDALKRAAGQKPAQLKDPDLSKKLFGENPFLSPTQIETFHSCRFKYFCRYGLNAKERRPAEVDVMQYGTLMHFLFERVFRQPADTRALWTEEQLEGLLRELIQQYAQENMGGLELLSGREKYRLDRLARAACRLIRHVEEELAQSSFVPEYFELKLGQEGFPPLHVELDDGRTVTVGGTIDRVDVFRRADEIYVRVIDYKTGKKDFRLADVLYGLNMQMLVYLAALVENGQQFPAGILYMPAAEPSVSIERKADEGKVKKESDRQMRMSGVVLSDGEIIRAMEAGAKGTFIPASLNKDGSLGRFSSTLNKSQLLEVLAYSKKLIAAMGSELLEGRVEAEPNLKNHNACRFCPYGAVCGKEYGEKDVEQDKTTAEEAMEKIERLLGKGEKRDG